MRLHCQEIFDGYAAARKAFDDRGLEVDSIGQVYLDLEVQRQLVARMLIEAGSEDPKATVFEDGNEARRELDQNEVHWFVDQEAKMQRKQMSSWVEDGELLPRLQKVLGLGDDTTNNDIVAMVESLKAQI